MQKPPKSDFLAAFPPSRRDLVPEAPNHPGEFEKSLFKGINEGETEMILDHSRKPLPMIGYRAAVHACFLVMLMCSIQPGPCAAASSDQPKRVLVIPSYNFNYLGSQWFLQGIMAEFTEHAPFKVTFFHENLQLASKSTDQQYQENMAASLKIKYAQEKPDLIIVQYRQALQFMEHYGQEIFGNVPVVFSGLTAEGGYGQIKLPDNYTGITASFSTSKNVELILQNHPTVKKIYVVGGSSPIEQDLVNEAIKEGKAHNKNVEFIALTNLSFSALLAQLDGIRENSVILYQVFLVDAEGKLFVPALAAMEIAHASRVPVYGMLDTYMGSGITGGFLIFHEGMGRRAAEIGTSILQEKGMPSIPLTREIIGSYRFDWRELKRWGIDEDNLPSGSKIEFKEFSVWDSYKWEIIGGICLILLQAFLIVGLLTNRFRRIKVEGVLRESETRFKTLAEASFEGIALTERGVFLDVNDQLASMLGYERSELVGRMVSEFIAPEYRDIVAEAQRTNRLDPFENAILCKTGTKIPVETRARRMQIGDKEIRITAMRDITARIRAEEALCSGERKLSEALRVAHMGHWEFDVMTGLFTFNDQYYSLHRTTVERVGGYQMTAEEFARNFVHPDDAFLVGTSIRQAMDAQDSIFQLQAEARILCSDGEIRWVGVWFHIEKDEQGRTVKLYGVNQDITERKQAEEEMKEKEHRYRVLFETANDGIFLQGTTGCFVDCNQKGASMYGLTREDLIVRSPAELSPERQPDGRLSSEVAAEKILAAFNGEPQGFEWQSLRADGVPFDVEVTVNRVEMGGSALLQAIVRDITERKQAEEALRASEEKYRHVVTNAHDAIFIVQEGFIKFPNPQLAIVSGYSLEELMQRSFLDFVYPDDRELVATTHQKRMKGEEVPSTYSFRAVNKPGNTLWVQVTSVFLPWEGRPASLNFLRDITVEKRLESQLVHAQKMEAVGTLAGGIAHDFNNLLQAVQGYSELLLLEKPEGEQGYRELQEIRRAAKRGGELTRQLLTFSRKVESKLQPVELNRIVEGVRLLLERTIPKMIKIELHLTGNLYNVNADASQVEQVLMNLAVNARDAMPDGGTLSIETSNVILGEEAPRSQPELTPGNYVLLAVTDTGQGMDKATLENIFDPFFTTKEVGKGTGLGLAMVYGIVKNHHGHITCVSKPGKGSAFEIYLPAIEQIEKAPATLTGTQPVRGGNETVLLVDDEDSLRDLGEQILQVYGYTVISAPDGESALEIYRDGKDGIDLVILDLIMPGMGGGQCLQEILGINSQAKVVIASGYPVNGETEKATESRAKAFIQKPYDVKQMLEVVRGVLDE